MQEEATIASPSQRRRLILISAQRLWGLDGYQAVSLRRIAGEAGVALTLIDHHYGTKQQLFSTVLSGWRQVFALPAKRIQAAQQQGQPLTLEALVDCLGEPARALQSEPQGEDALRFAFKHLADSTPEVKAALHPVFGPVQEAFVDALQQLYPGQSRGRLVWAYLFAISMVFEFALADAATASAAAEADTTDTADASAVPDHFTSAEAVRFVVAALQAALSNTPARNAGG